MPTPFAEEFSQRLRSVRKERGYTQYSFADALKTPRQNVQGYETAGKFPKYEMLVRMAKLLGVSTDYLLGIDTDAIPTIQKSIFIAQRKGLEEAYNAASRERQHTVDCILLDIYTIMDAALKTTDDHEMGLYIDLFNVARRITDVTHGDEQAD